MKAIPPLMNLLLVFAFAGLGLLESRRLARRWPDVSLDGVLGRARYLYLLVPAALAFLVAEAMDLLSADVAWDVPLWIEYQYTALLWGSVLALFSFLFALGVSLAFRLRDPRRTRLGAAALLAIAAIETVQWSNTRPLAASLAESVRDGVVLQTSASSCACAAAANVARSLGVVASERSMAELLGTTVHGTTAAQVVYGLRRAGVSCTRVAIRDGDARRLHAPAMLFIDYPGVGPESHAVVYSGAEGDRSVILDPERGRRTYDRAGLARIWRGHGLECRRSDG